jgi:hypothetical protein
MIIVIVSVDEISLKPETAFIKRESSRTTVKPYDMSKTMHGLSLKALTSFEM